MIDLLDITHIADAFVAATLRFFSSENAVGKVLGLSLELVGTRRAVVLTIATELPECSNPELADIDMILQRRAKSATPASIVP